MKSESRAPSMTRRRFASLTMVGALALVACGSSGDTATTGTSNGESGDAVLSGVVRDPAPVVDGTALAELASSIDRMRRRVFGSDEHQADELEHRHEIERDERVTVT